MYRRNQMFVIFEDEGSPRFQFESLLIEGAVVRVLLASEFSEKNSEISQNRGGWRSTESEISVGQLV